MSPTEMEETEESPSSPLVQVASLVDMRLLSRVASKEWQIDAARLRCEAPKDFVESVAEELGFELRQYEKE